jgi:hypothetical protein
VQDLQGKRPCSWGDNTIIRRARRRGRGLADLTIGTGHQQPGWQLVSEPEPFQLRGAAFSACPVLCFAQGCAAASGWSAHRQPRSSCHRCCSAACLQAQRPALTAALRALACQAPPHLSARCRQAVAVFASGQPSVRAALHLRACLLPPLRPQSGCPSSSYRRHPAIRCWREEIRLDMPLVDPARHCCPALAGTHPRLRR